MKDFELKMKPERFGLFGNREFIELKTGKFKYPRDSHFSTLYCVLSRIKDLWRLKDLGTLERLDHILWEMLKREIEIENIHHVLSSSGHELISSEEKERLLARQKEIIAELKQVLSKPEPVPEPVPVNE